MRGWVPLLLVGLVGCHGPEYFPAPPAAPVPAVAPTRISIIPSPPELPIGGGTTTLYIETTAGQGTTTAPGVRVELVADSGNLEAETVTTDRTGHAKLTWTGERSSVITARAGDVQTSANVRVLVPTPTPPPTPAPPRPPSPPPVDPLPPTPPAPANPEVTVTLTATPTTVLIGQPVTLTAAVTTNSDAGPIRHIHWDFDGDGTPEILHAGDVMTTSYSTTGTKRPIATAVSSSWAVGSGTTTVNVTLPALVVNLAVAPAGTNPPGTSLTFTATVTSAGSVPTPLTFEWDFNNDGVLETTTSGGSPQTAPTNYNTVGAHTVKVTVRASDGRATSTTLQVVVK